MTAPSIKELNSPELPTWKMTEPKPISAEEIMLPIKRILCPVDFSPFSDDALTKAGELALHFGAELYILHVTQTVDTDFNIDPLLGAMPGDNGASDQQIRECSGSKIEQLIQRLHFGELEVHSLIREGKPADMINAAAKEGKIDLIVTATHGTGGWRHLVFGSVAEHVIRNAPCPVLVVHAQNTPIEG
jgi:nucleotide-binding universal stress UspA family protein